MQVNSLLEKALVEEAVLLAETIAAVEASRDPRFAEEVSETRFVKLNIAFWCFA